MTDTNAALAQLLTAARDYVRACGRPTASDHDDHAAYRALYEAVQRADAAGSRADYLTRAELVEALHTAAADECQLDETVTRAELEAVIYRGTMPSRTRTAAGRYAPGGGVVTSALLLRVSPEQRSRWEAAAQAAGQTLSAWIRAQLDAKTRTKRG